MALPRENTVGMVSSQVSHYRVLTRLGQGGMGEVYLAEDLTLDRQVALKFLLAGLADAGADRRLLREAKAAAHLDHPFICKVYEVGEHEGRPFLATEFVDGETLTDRLAKGRLRIDEALRIAAEVAEALQFAHTRGIVHRDVKPANVMLGTDGHVKVMDFGIAKRLDAPVGADSNTIALPTATVPGELTGTLAYMSPEQLRGEAVDERSDTFAFGLLLHELLTGKHPFLRASIFETANAILNEPAPPLDPSIHEKAPLLANVVARCLEKDRDRRWQSLSDVRIELENLGGAPPPPSAPARRRSRWIMAPVLAGLVAIVGIVNWMHPLPFLATERALAFKERDWIIVADFNNMTGDPVFDRSLRVALEVGIAQSQYVNVYPQDRVAATLQRMKHPPVTHLDEKLAAEVAERENVRGLLACDISQVGNTYSLVARLIRPDTGVMVRSESVTAANKDGILAALDELGQRVRRDLGESVTGLSGQSKPLPKATTSSLEALKLYSDAMFDQRPQKSERDTTDELLRQALRLDPHFALAHAELGRRYYLLSNHEIREEGEKHFQEALAETDRLTLRERLWIQAVAEDSRGNRERAVQAYETYLGQYPDDVGALFRVSWTRMATLGEPDKAIEGFKRVVALDPGESAAWINLATSYTAKRDYEQALPSYRQAFALNPALILGVFTNHEYGFTLVNTGKTAEAEAVFDRMTKEADPPSLRARGFRSLAILDMYRGRYTAAIEQLRHAIAIDQTYKQDVSEFRDRLYLVTALDALGRSGETSAESATLDRLIAKLELGPEWLIHPLKIKARRGDAAGAKRLMELMLKTVGRATADSSVARNSDRDRAWVDLAQGEIELADKRPQRAIELIENANIVIKSANSLESLANAYAAAGRVADAAARYEEIVRAPHLGDESQELWQRSHVALARLYQRLNRPDEAKQLYAAVVDRWKEGDSDLVLLKASRGELARLAPVAGH